MSQSAIIHLFVYLFIICPHPKTCELHKGGGHGYLAAVPGTLEVLRGQESPLRFITQEQTGECPPCFTRQSQKPYLESQKRMLASADTQIGMALVPWSVPMVVALLGCHADPCKRQGSWRLSRAGPAANHGHACCEHLGPPAPSAGQAQGTDVQEEQGRGGDTSALRGACLRDRQGPCP